MVSLVALALAWVAWCIGHSLLIWPPVERRLRDRLGGLSGAYRLAYNLLSFSTLAPLLWMHWSLRGPRVVHWRGGWMALPVLLNLAALALFVLGSKAHGASDFLGIQSAVAAFKGKPRAPNRALSMGGILSWVRHPWYAGTLLLLWGHDLDAAGLVASAVLTAYIIVGTLLEEQKLAASFGRAYREYQRRVPMFIPRRPSK